MVISRKSKTCSPQWKPKPNASNQRPGQELKIDSQYNDVGNERGSRWLRAEARRSNSNQKLYWAPNLTKRPPMICIAFRHWLFCRLYRVCSLSTVLLLNMLKTSTFACSLLPSLSRKKRLKRRSSCLIRSPKSVLVGIRSIVAVCVHVAAV